MVPLDPLVPVMVPATLLVGLGEGLPGKGGHDVLPLIYWFRKNYLAIVNTDFSASRVCRDPADLSRGTIVCSQVLFTFG